MKILVPVKRVVDYNVKVHVKSDHSDVDIAHVKMSMNPFDEIAVEEAIKLKENKIADEIVLITFGTPAAQETLRAGLAMGADRGILVTTNVELQPLAVAKLLKVMVEKEQPNLIIMGKQAIDDDCNQTGQMLAGLLNWPQGTFVSKMEVKNNKVTAIREVDGGLETLILHLPAVITTDLRLNTPRYISLPNIMKAKKKPIETIMADLLGIDIKPRLQQLQVEPPPKRQRGIMVKSVAELIEKLREREIL